METLLRWDTDFFLFLNGLRTDWGDVFWYYVSQIWIWIPLYLFIIWCLAQKFKRRAWVVVPLFFLMIFFTDQTCNLLKNTVQRQRPSHTEAIEDEIHLVQKPDGTYYYGGKYGFPSAHAANSMALAFAVFVFLGRRKKWVLPIMIGWSLLLAYSRIYLGVHYPLDVLTGFLVGTFWALTVSACYFYFEKKRR